MGRSYPVFLAFPGADPLARMAREPATMNAFEHARDLTGRGQFTDALHAWAAATAHEQRSAPVETLRAELLERTGEYEAAQAIAARLVARRDLQAGDRSICEVCPRPSGPDSSRERPPCPPPCWCSYRPARGELRLPHTPAAQKRSRLRHRGVFEGNGHQDGHQSPHAILPFRRGTEDVLRK
jgi:hypothetical protein